MNYNDEELKREIAELKMENEWLRTKVEELEVECKKINKKTDITRDSLNANVVAINREMIKKKNTYLVAISGVVCSILMMVSVVALNIYSDFSLGIFLLSATLFSMFIMVISTFILIYNSLSDLRDSIKDEKNR